MAPPFRVAEFPMRRQFLITGDIDGSQKIAPPFSVAELFAMTQLMIWGLFAPPTHMPAPRVAEFSVIVQSVISEVVSMQAMPAPR